MKRSISTCAGTLMLILAGLGASAAVKTVTWQLPTDWEAHVQYGESDGRLAISGPDFGYPSDPVGAPALPFLPVSIKVAEGSVLSNCVVDASWTEVKDEGGQRLRPSIINEPHIVGEAPIYSPEDPQYFGAARYPATPESIGGVQTCAEDTSIMAWVTPYRWNGQTGKLEKATALKLTFTYDAPRTKPRLSTSSTTYTGLFLIISPSQFKDMWGNYLTYRQKTHPQIEFEVVNTADIYANYDGKDDAQRIHKYLEYRYKNRGGRTMYVILGGGCKKDSESYNRATMIPLPMTATRNRLYYPSDLYYACMDNPAGKGEVWDPNNDGILLGYKSGGGYVSDARNQVDVMPDIAVSRFPVRPTASLDGKSKSAQQQIDGLVAKLQRAEAANFAGNHNAGLAGLKIFAEKSHGNTENWMTQERTFYDGMVNIWSASHASPVDDFEYNLRNQHVNWWFQNRPLNNFYGATSGNPNAVANNNMEFYVNEAHGAPSGAGPLSNTQMWKATAIQKIALWDMPCSTGRIDDDRLTLPEAMILNPDGGALVSYNNAREGYGSANNFDTLSALMERENRRAYLANDLNNRTSGEAFIEAHRTFLNSVGGIQMSTTAMSCYIETLAFGDPLVKLSQVQDGNVGASPSGLFLRTGTTTATDINVGSQSSVVTLKTPDLGGGTLTIRGQSFKAYKGATVNNGNLVWDAPGGVGGSGLKFTTARGNLTVSATGTTYFGPNFSNVDNLLVTGYNCTLDFDKTGATRDVTQLGFIGTGTSNSASGTNYLRCREGGIFSPTMTIPVVNGTLALQTQNVGGGGAATYPNVPLFVLTNATLRVDTNPNWGAEFFNRAIWLNNSAIEANYQSVGFGANVDARPGLDIYVFGDKGSVIAGPQDFEIVGELRVHCEDGARITSTASLNKSSRTGSISKLGSGTLTLSAKNTVSGGVRVKEGTLVADTGTCLGTGEVIVESGAVLQLKTLPVSGITRLTIKNGGKLILPGSVDTASYKIVDPLVSSLRFENGSIVCNVNAPDTPLSGSTTTDGCYLDTSLFLNWKGGSGNWSTATTDTNWKTKTVESKAFAQGDSVQFPDYGKVTNTVTVSGALTPGQINFSNPDTAYRFKGTGASISLGTLYTGGDVSFEPSLAVDGTMAVTAGRTEVNNVGATAVSVGPDATFKVNGEVASYVYINKIVLNVSKFYVNYYDMSWIGGGKVVDCKGWQIGDLRFYRGTEVVTLPVGTTVAVNCPNAISSGKMQWTTLNATVTSSANGVVSAMSGDGNAVKPLLDGNTGTYLGCIWNASAQGEHNYAPSCTITITPPTPIKMFTGYKIAGANNIVRNPENWTLSVTENSTGSSKAVSTKTGMYNGTTGNWWPSASGTGYSLDSTPSASGSTAVSVAAGGALENGGTYKAKVNFADGAKIKVGGSGTINVASGVTFGGNTTVDVSEAQKISGWREILAGANLAAADVYKFPLSSDDAVAKVESGKLYVATENIVKGPYSRQVSGTCNWNTADWKNGDAAFPDTWANVITRPNGVMYLDVTAPTTMTLDAPAMVGSVYVTNTTQNAASLNLVKSGNNAIMATLLDFSGFNGPVVWEPSVNGASVNVGMNVVTLSEGSGATLTVASNGFATVVGPFAGYSVDKFARVHFLRTGRGLNMSQIPACGTVSFDGMELQDGGGGFQKGDLTYRVENGQSLTLKETGSMNARTQSSFEIYGGSVTINPNGAWWFGQNGVTSYTQTNGTVTVNATGTTVASSGSGVVFGYTGEASFVFEMNISGGRFEVPNSILNIWNPTTISLSSNAVLKAKGAGARSGVAGIIEVGDDSIFEIGSTGLAGGSMKYNLYGGTLAAFENTTIGAPIELGGAGTFAAKDGTTLTVNGAINSDGATLNIGKAGYAGTVKFSASPAGVTNYNVVAGTWDLGALRPSAATILQMGDGLLKLTLSNDELVQAATTGLAVFKTTLPASSFTNKIKIYTPNATELNGISRVENGNLVVSVGYVYPLKAVAVADTAWENLDWVDSIGMEFLGDWANVTSAELTNELSGVTLTVPTAFTNSLTVVNGGELVLSTSTPETYALSSLDDSLSTGKTTVGFTANNVVAGAETVIKKAGSGMLTLANGKCAALWNNLNWPAARISGFSGTAKIKYVGDETLTSLNYTSAAGGIVSYAQKVDMSTGTLQFNASLTRCFEEGLDMKVYRMSNGNQSGSPTETFYQTGGRIEALSAEDMSDNPTGASPLLFAHWPGAVTYYLTGGELVATNGVSGSVYFGRDGVPKLYIGNGTAKATLRTNGFVNRSDTKDKTGSVVELLPNGFLEIGNKNFVLYQNAELKMSGGTFLAYENAEILSDTSKFTLTADTSSRLAAAAGKTLTVSKVPTGTGTLICGDATNNGEVILTGGSYANLTLGGTFTIRLTDDQQSATLDVPIFKAAADLNPDNVTVVTSDGTAIEGVKSVKDGKLCWAPATGYMQPIVATVSGSKDWTALAWKDSASTPRDVPSTFWSSVTTANVKLIVEGEAAITEPSSAITVATTEVTGTGRLSLPQNNLALGTVKGDGTIVCNGFCKKYAGLNQSAWTGTYVLTGNASCTGTDGYDFTDLGNVNSVVEADGISGWFNGCSTCVETPFKGTFHNYTLCIGANGLRLSDGSSDQGYCFAKLDGEGDLWVGKDSDGPSSRVIALDATDFCGALKVTGNSGIIVGTPSATTGNGTIAIDGQYNVAYGTAKLTAANGVTVRANGVLNLLQTDASQKTWPITGNTLTVNGSVTVNGALVLSRNWKVEGGTIVLKDEPINYPAILESSYLWLDATESASITTGDSGEVSEWKSVVGDKSAASYTATGVTAGPTVTQNAFNGNAVVDFGAVGSGKDLSFTRATTIKAVFMVVDIAQTQGAFLLGDGTTFHFHRGSGGNYFSGNPPAEIKTNGKTYRNGVLVADPVNTKIPTGYGLIEVIPQDTSTQICAERICADRNCSDSNVYRNGGKKVGELIILTTAPTEDERRAIENYLMGKWGFGYSATVTDTPAEFTTGEGVDVLGGYSAGADFAVKNPTVADATFNIGKAITVGAFTVNAAQPLTITANGGSVAAASINDSASAAKTVLDFATGTAPITAGADTVLTKSGTGAITVGANKKVTLGDGVTTGAITVNAAGTVRREGTITGSDNFSTLMASDGYYEFKNAVITGNMESKSNYDGRKLVVREGDNVILTSTGDHKGTDISVYVHGGALRYTTAATWFASDVYYVQDGGTVAFDATGDGTANNAAVIPGYTGGSKTASMAISGGLTDISKTSIRFDQTSAITVSGTGTLKVKGINGNTSNQHPITVSEQGKLLIGSNNWLANVGALTLGGGTFGAFENATMAANATVFSASTMCAANGKTMTVSGVVSGAGGLTIGEAGYAGTVKFTAAPTYTGATTLAYGMLEVPAGALAGNVTINAGTTLNLTGMAGAASYVVTAGNVSFGDGASIANITLNGKAFEGNWELVNGTLVERYEVISVNIGGGENGSGASPSGYLVTGDAAVGLEAVPGKHWNNIDGRWASDAAVKTKTIIAGKAYNRTAEVSRPSVKVTASANNTYGYSSATTAFFKGYLDDGGDHAHITVEGIPYPCYDVIVYGTADSGSYKLAPITVNGESYTWNGTETVKGTGTWGATQASTPAYGSNALLIKGLTTTTLTIVGGANANTARGGLAAFQIVNRATNVVESVGFVMTVADSRNLTDYDCTPSPFVPSPFNSLTLDVTAADPVTATVADDLTLEMLAVQSAAGASLTIAKSAGAINVSDYDFSAAAGKTTLDFDIGTTPFAVGSGWLKFGGTMSNFDWSAYTGKTIELAGGYSIAANARLNASTMILSGTGSTSNNENGLRDGAHVVIPSGTFTLSQRFVVGQGANNQTMRLDITGGTLASGGDGFMYTGGYSGNTLHTTLSAGSWTANYIVWNDNGATANTFNVNTFGTGLFAPAFVGTIDGNGNKVANDRDVSGGYRHHVYLGKGGTFRVPAVVPNWLEVVVTNGTGTITAQTASSVIRSRVTVDVGTTLDFDLGADKTIEFKNDTKTNAELVNNGTVKVSSGTFKLAKGVTLAGDVVVEKGAALDIATDTPEAEEFVVTTGNLTFNGTLKVNGTVKDGVWTGKDGKIVRGELKDFHATVTGSSVNFSKIVWDEGTYSSATNHTVTINAPDGCEIVIDQSITNQSFTVNCTGTCTVRVANDSTVALAQGFLGESYSVFYDNAEYGAVLTAFSLNGSTGWTDNHAVDFYYTLVDPNGLDLVFTGAVDAQSGISVNDVGNKGGSVTFSNNLTTVDYFFIGNGTARFATTDQITIGTLSTYELYSGHIVMAAKTDAAAIKVIDADDWGVSLDGVMLDIDTFTDAPIPESTVEYKLITAPSIDKTGVVLGSSFKGNWELEVVDNGNETQTLVARKIKKGFSFIIADVETEQVQTTVAIHDDTSKHALDIDRDWVAEKADLSDVEKQDDDAVMLAINTEGENGAKLFESYVLGLEPTDAASRPVPAPVQTDDPTRVGLKLGNVSVNPRAGANSVTYRVYASAEPGGEKTLVTETPIRASDMVAVDLPENGVRYYTLEVSVN